MKNKLKLGLIISLLTWVIFFIADFSLAQANKSPIFSISLQTYDDGGSAEYYGLGYKVNKYVYFSAEKGVEVIQVDFGSWAMPFSHPQSE